jgi:hypothetical protein
MLAPWITGPATWRPSLAALPWPFVQRQPAFRQKPASYACHR